MNGIKAVIFDMDGTLIDPRIDVANALNASLSHFELPPLSYQEIFNHIQDGMKHLIQRTFPPSHGIHLEEAVRIYRDHYDAHLLDHTTLYPHIRDILEALKTLEKAVVSNKREQPLLSILEGLNLHDHFKAVFGSDTLGVRKPAPDAVLKTLECLNVRPHECLMVGDSPEDIQAGKSAGVKTCGVTYGFRAQQVLRRENPDYLLNDVKDLLKIVGF